MVSLSRSIHVSLAFKSQGVPYGGNWQVEMPEGSPLDDVKRWLDHRCLYTDVPEFAGTDSTPEMVARAILRRHPEIERVTIHASETEACVATLKGTRLMIATHNLRLELEANESSLMTLRDQVTRAVNNLLGQYTEPSILNEKQWGERLFADLKRSLVGLVRLNVDLSGGKYIVVE